MVYIKCDNALTETNSSTCNGTQYQKLSKAAFLSTQAKLPFNPQSKAETADESTSSASGETVHDIYSSECSASTSKQKHILGYSYAREDVISAKVVWAAKCAHSTISFRANDGIGETFKALCHCPIEDGFSMNRTKLYYLVSNGLGPGFTFGINIKCCCMM